MINRFNSYVKKSNYVRRTINELSSLSDRELNDIGISRYDIRSIARDTAKSIAF